MQDKPEISACEHCQFEIPIVGFYRTNYFVSCLRCGMRGPIRNSPEGAVEEWNTIQMAMGEFYRIQESLERHG